MTQRIYDLLVLTLLRLVWDPWILTFTGRRVHLLRPDPKSIQLEDIAHALSQINRFTGHTAVPYSVAQHSVHVARLFVRGVGGGETPHGPLTSDFPDRIAAALLHDAHEAYIGDVAAPLKRLLRSVYGPIERMWERTIRERFLYRSNNGPLLKARIRLADMRALATERRDLMHPSEPQGCFDLHLPAPDQQTLKALSSEQACAQFLAQANLLGLR